MSDSMPTPPAWQRAVGRLAAIGLGAVLLIAAWAKAIDPVAFGEQIRALGLDLLLPAGAIAMLAVALEAGLGSALILGARRLVVLVPTGLLVVFFLLLTGRAWWRSAHGMAEAVAGCGCFGNLVQRTPAQAFLEDALLMVPALALAFLARPRARRFRKRLVAAGVIGVAALLLAWRAPSLPLDDLATRLRPGVSIDALCVGEEGTPGRVCLSDIVPEAENGRDWVILTELDTAAFTRVIPDLNRYVLRQGKAGVWVVCTASTDDVQSFMWQWGPAFEIRQAPPALMRPLYRRLPRSFEVQDGIVTATIDGVPPGLSGNAHPHSAAEGD